MIHAHDLDSVEYWYYYCCLKLQNALSYQSDDPIRKVSYNYVTIIMYDYHDHLLYIHLKMICCDLTNETYLVVDLYLNDDVNN